MTETAIRPWFKFYPNAWRSDELLRPCSIAARGLWIEMLCLMHKAAPRGYLLINGEPPTETHLGDLVGVPTEQISELLRELESAGTFSRSRAGVIFSRRMVREEKKSREAVKNGKKGGNPSLCETTGKSDGVKGQDKPPLKPKRTEDRGQKDKRDNSLPVAARDAAAGHVEVIQALDASIVTHFGPAQARAWPHATDRLFAERWLAEGISVEVCRAVVDAACGRKAKAGARPPGMLKYFDAAVREAAKTVAARPAVGGGGYDPADPVQRRRADIHAERVKALLAAKVPPAIVVAGGDWGAMADDAFRAKIAEMSGGGHA
jgi:hypothetical protein